MKRATMYAEDLRRTQEIPFEELAILLLACVEPGDRELAPAELDLTDEAEALP